MDEEDVLLKLLNVNPDPPVFCFHKALLGSAHQCSSPDSREHCHTATALAMSTPVQLKKIFSPQDLELDSDTSSVIAGWSFSMATPTCPWLDAGKNPMAANSSISTTDEGSSSVSTESGCGLEEESPPVRDKSDEDTDKSLLKIRNKTVFSKHKPVPRTLFPPKTTTLKAAKTQQRSTLEPFNYFSPIPPAMSPLVCTSHHAQSVTPLKHQLNNSIASTSLFETPVKEASHHGGDQPHGASSQDMFGSPEIFTPLVDVGTVEKLNKKSIEAEHEGNVHVEEEAEDVCSKELSQGCASNSDRGQSLSKSPAISMPCTDQNLLGLSPSPDHKPLTCNSVDIQPIVHSTPLYSHNNNNEIIHPPPSCTACPTPDVPVEHVHEPSPHVNELTTPRGEAVHVAATPVKGETNKSAKLSYNFGSTDNVLDLLFMSPPELDKYLSKNRHDTTIVESKLPKSAEDINEPYKEELATVPFTQQDAMCETTKSNAVSSDMQEAAVCGCDVAESVQNLVVSVAMEVREANDKPSENPGLKPYETNFNAGKRNATSDTTLSEPELQPPVKRLKRKRTTSFLYPGSKQLTSTKKRTRYTYISKKDDMQIAQKPLEVPTDSCTCAEKVDHSLIEHSDNDGEPPPKKAHIEEQGGDHVTTIDESVMEYSSQNKRQDTGFQVSVSDAVLQFKEEPDVIVQIKEDSSDFNTKEYTENVAKGCTNNFEMKDHPDSKVEMNSHCPEQCNNDSEPGLLKDDQQPVHSHSGEIHKHLLESVVKSSSLRKLRTPGLSRRHPVTRRLNPPQETIREEGCNAQSDSRSIEMQVPADPIHPTVSEKPQADVPTAFAGFCTASGSTISISKQAMEKAKSLLSGELDWKDNDLVPSSEQPQKLGSSVSSSVQTTSPLTVTPASVTSPATLVVPSESSKPFPTPLAAFKTPLHAQSKLSHPASVPNRTHVVSKTKRPASTFKAPRKADSVSKDEEKASIARILRGFRASGAGPSGSARRDPVEMKVKSNPKKRMVSGFSTAAGSKLTISSESMEKAQQLLMSDKENGMIDDLQELPETFETATAAIVRPTEMTGFKTAFGKGLSVSASAMDKAKQIAKSIDQVTDVHTKANETVHDGKVNVTVGFQTAAGKSLSVSSKALLTAETVLSSISEDSTDTAEVEAKPDVQNNYGMLQTGFQTAGGSHISVSSKSLERAQKIVDEEKSDPSESGNMNPGRCLTGFSTTSGSTISVLKTSLVKAQSDMESVAENIQREKITTENTGDVSKNVQVKESLDCSLTAEDVDTLGCFTQFSFHKNNPSESLVESQSNIQTDNTNISVDAKDLKNATHELKIDQHNVPSDDEDSHSHYFSTQVVKQLLEFSSDEDLSMSDDKDLATGSNEQDCTITQSCQENVLNVESEKDHPLENELGSSPVLCQANHAPGVSHVPDETQDICVDPDPVITNQVSSMESLAPVTPANNMMEITTAENDESVLNNEQEMLTESMVESMNISAIAASCSDDFVGLLESCSDTNKIRPSQQHQAACTTGFSGLQTASGKEVSICQESLEAAKATLDGNMSTRPAGGFPGLQTASGTPVNISKEALQAAKATLENSTPVHHSSGFPGLQTASGTHVNISKGALEAARATLDDSTSDSVRRSSGFPGLQTASGNKVSISSESLAAAKAVLNEKTSAPTSYGFPCLQTASGNKVSISNESLDAARSVLNSNTNTLSTGGYPGLQNASGAQVNISKESLKAARENVCNKDTNSSFPGLQTGGGTKVNISRESLEAVRNILGGVETKSHSFSNTDNEWDSHTRPANCPSQTPCCTTHQTPRGSLSHSDSTNGLGVAQDGKYRPIFKSAAVNKGGFHVPISRSVDRESSRGESSVNRNESNQSQPVKTTTGVISTPEATLCDRANHPKRRPLLPSQSHLEPASNPRHSNHSYSHFVPSHSSYSSAHRQPSNSINTFKTPHRPSANSMQVQQVHQEMSASFSSPQLGGNLSRTDSANFTPISNQPVPPAYTNRSFSYSRTVTGKQSDRYSTCTPVWKASLGKRTSNNDTHSGYRNHRRSIVFTPVQKKPADYNILTSTDPAHQHHNVNSSFPNTQTQTTPYSERSKLTDNAPSAVVENTRTSTQVNATSNRDCELAIPLSPLHVTLSQLNAMEDLDVEMQSTVNTGKDATIKTTNDSGYVSREASATKSPSPGTEYENCRLSTDTHKQKESCVDNPTSIVAVSTNDESKTCEIDEMVFAEVAKERLDDSLEVDDTELPEDVLYNKSDSTDNRYTRTTRENTSMQTISTSSMDSAVAIASSDVHGVKTHHTAAGSVIKPQTGSLLAARDEHKSSRIPLQSAMRGHLPGRYTQSELHSFGVHHKVMSVTASNAVEFCFSGSHFFSSTVLSGAPVCVGDGAMLTLSNGIAGLHQFWNAFRVSPGVDQKLMSLKWFTNHYKQLVWKLASMECSYPHMFAGRCLTPDRLMIQMKYRYDREIDRAQRPALCKICEQDDVASRRMVLCVSHINSENLQHVHNVKNRSIESGNETVLVPNDSIKEDGVSITENQNPPCIVLTDGWYSLPGVVDPPLKHMLKSGKIFIGTKLLVSGTELLGMSEPCHPLEAPSSCCLKISSNSTRRARWFAKLGYQPVPHAFRIPLESVYSEGGMVGCTHALIARVYPMVYLEKKEGSKNVFRNEKMELKVAAQYESERQKKIDCICTRVQREFEEELAKRDSNSSSSKGRRSRRLNTLQIKQLQDGEDIYNALTNASDPIAFQGMLTRTQLVLLESYRQCLLSQRQDELQQRIKQAVQEAEDQLPPARNVVSLLKVRLVPLNEGLQRPVFDCHLSIWRPNDTVKEILKEGTALRLSNITANPSKYKGNNQQRIQLTATRSTRYHPLNIPTDEHFSNYIPRLHTPISQLNTSELAYGEFDTVGMVVCVTSGHVPSRDLERPDRILDTFYLANHDGNLLEVKVWDGLKSHGLKDTVQAGKSLALSNLSYRGIGHTHQLPTATAGDITAVSQQPRQAHLRDALRELNTELPNRRDRSTFLQTLEDEISTYL